MQIGVHKGSMKMKFFRDRINEIRHLEKLIRTFLKNIAMISVFIQLEMKEKNLTKTIYKNWIKS